MQKNLIVFLFLFYITIFPSNANNLYENEKIVIGYDELIELSDKNASSKDLFDKLDYQLNTPLIVQPKHTNNALLHNEKLGDYFRIVSWNIERGYNADKIIEVLTEPNKFSYDDKLKSEAKLLADGNIFIFNEVDIGIPRTNYENIAQKIANALMAGYIFAPEFIELDPYQLGIKKLSDSERYYIEDSALKQIDNIDKSKYKGLHGNLIVSKYPILSASVIRLPECYDWFNKESEKLTLIEKAKRTAAREIVAEKLLTEIRRGGRSAIIADILLPNKEIVTVVSVHLENRCQPDCRLKQLKALLGGVTEKKNTIVLAGDFNTTGTDASPTSLKKEVLNRFKDPGYLARKAVIYLTPIGWIEDFTSNTVNKIRQLTDPTGADVPIILPNKEKKIFDYIIEYKFFDGYRFDNEGDKSRAIGAAGFLGNSNQRRLLGFEPTFEANRAFGILKYKLDWIFVKPGKVQGASYAYKPHFGRTYKEVVGKGDLRLSDHSPISVDIPTSEPKI